MLICVISWREIYRVRERKRGEIKCEVQFIDRQMMSMPLFESILLKGSSHNESAWQFKYSVQNKRRFIIKKEKKTSEKKTRNAFNCKRAFGAFNYL